MGQSVFKRELTLDMIYPVGSIYMSVNSTNPGTLFGGSWQRLTGRFLLGATDGGAAGGNSNANIAPGYTGGEAAHTITTGEMASHNHGQVSLTGSFGIRRDATDNVNVTFASGIVSQDLSVYGPWPSTARGANQMGDRLNFNATHTHSSVGSNSAHNTMPPYLAVYIWKRTS